VPQPPAYAHLHTREGLIALAFPPSTQSTNHSSEGTLWSLWTTLLVAESGLECAIW